MLSWMAKVLFCAQRSISELVMIWEKELFNDYTLLNRVGSHGWHRRFSGRG
jgi:hypothetical protein